MDGLRQDTIDAVENAILLQMQRLEAEEDFGPNEWAQIANAGANLLDKMTGYLQEKNQAQMNFDRLEVERMKVEVEKQKVECDSEKNRIDSEKLEFQKISDAKKIKLERMRIAFEKESTDLRTEVELKKSQNEICWKRIVVDVAKIAIPAGVSIGTLLVWKESMHEIMHFEETGKLCTAAANKFMKLPHLPGF